MPYAKYSRRACDARIAARARAALLANARQAIADIGRPIVADSSPEEAARLAADAAEFRRLLAAWEAAGKPGP